MDRIQILGMAEANSDIEPTDDTKAIWAKLVSSYGEDKAAAILIGLVDQLGKDYFDQLGRTEKAVKSTTVRQAAIALHFTHPCFLQW